MNLKSILCTAGLLLMLPAGGHAASFAVTGDIDDVPFIGFSTSDRVSFGLVFDSTGEIQGSGGPETVLEDFITRIQVFRNGNLSIDFEAPLTAPGLGENRLTFSDTSFRASVANLDDDHDFFEEFTFNIDITGDGFLNNGNLDLIALATAVNNESVNVSAAFILQNDDFGTLSLEQEDLAASLVLDEPPPSVVPLPPALPLLLASVSALGFVRWRKRRNAV